MSDIRKVQPTGGAKDNLKKPRVELLPVKPLLAAAEVAGIGAEIYSPHNWRLGLSWTDQVGSIMRHVLAFADGEDIDPQTGKSHLAHALTQTMFLTEFYLTGTGIDDRWSSMSQAEKDEARA